MRWLIFLLATSLFAQTDISGEWVVRLYESEQPQITRLSLKREGDKFTGMVGGTPAVLAIEGTKVTLTTGSVAGSGVLQGDEITGEVKRGDRVAKWSATRIPPRPAQPRTHDFEPTKFELYFTSLVEPVLRIHPGDTVRTWAVDAGGADKMGTRRSGGGNPQTGPFYVEGALPGDTLVVRINKLTLNRDWAVSGSTVMRNALDARAIEELKWTPRFASRWKLDRAAGTATLAEPTDKLKSFTVPLAPLLGCIGVAPPDRWSIRTVDSGRFGGNMDYNQIREGTTVYLPVNHVGALLFVGDGHAAQGDGELTGDALETSMDIDFTADVIPGRNFGHPLAENSEYLMSIGIGGSLDQALQMATSGMMRWLERDYKLSASESAIVVGFAMKYDVADLVGTQVSIVAKLPKAALARLGK
jgi:acetamidase/formamidase